jgi:hypothetical protein
MMPLPVTGTRKEKMVTRKQNIVAGKQETVARK